MNEFFDGKTKSTVSMSRGCSTPIDPNILDILETYSFLSFLGGGWQLERERESLPTKPLNTIEIPLIICLGYLGDLSIPPAGRNATVSINVTSEERTRARGRALAPFFRNSLTARLQPVDIQTTVAAIEMSKPRQDPIINTSKLKRARANESKWKRWHPKRHQYAKWRTWTTDVLTWWCGPLFLPFLYRIFIDERRKSAC